MAISEILSRYANMNRKEIECDLCDEIQNKLQEKYGENPDSLITQRFEEEWNAVKLSDMIFDIAALYEIVLWLKQNNYPYWLRGTAGSSFLLYLLGITQGNPLPSHCYCPKCKTVYWNHLYSDGFDVPQTMQCENDGSFLIPDGHNIPWQIAWGYDDFQASLYIDLPTNLYSHFCDVMSVHWLQIIDDKNIPVCEGGEKRHIKQSRLNLQFILKEDKVSPNFYRQQIKATDSRYILQNWKSIFADSFLAEDEGPQKPEPKCIADLVSLMGCSYINKTWDDTAKLMITEFGYSLADLIIFKDDVYFYLINHGLSEKAAWYAMHLSRLDVNKKDGFPLATDEMKSAHDKWVLDRCQRAKYFLPKSHKIEYLLFRFKIHIDSLEQADREKKLLDDVKFNLSRYEQERRKTWADFNVFNTIGMTEVSYCRVICALINPKESHGYGGQFLKLFLETVLKQRDFSDEEINKALVKREKAIKNSKKNTLQGARRIDIYICVGKRAFPIEVKIDAPDQDSQCYDYYIYAQNEDKDEDKDSQTSIYYLTLDRHMPSDESRKELKLDKQLKLISFGKEIMEWLEKCRKYAKHCIVMKTMIEQFMDNINRLTGNEGGYPTMEIITDFETFKAANTIADSVSQIKTKKMKELFEKIMSHLEKRGYPAEDSDYKAKVDKYYYQSTSTYPGLNYVLDENNSLVLRIEIDHNLYMGICQWDKERGCISDKSEPNKEVVEKKMGAKEYWEDKSDSYYRWVYLPTGRNIDFKDFSGLYAELFNGDESVINEICDQVENILEIWEVPVQKTHGT